MIITESLAKGLKNRFFDEAKDNITIAIDSLQKEARNYKESKSGWKKLVLKSKKILHAISICFYEGGSNTSPYFAFVGLSIDKDRKFNSWNEMCLSGEVVIQAHKRRFCDTSSSSFNIGEHAISRIYERSKLRFIDPFTVDIHSILPEFKMLPLWSSFWIGNLAVITNNFTENYLTHFYHPIIPAKSGLFLCELTHVKFPKIEVRTFVDDKNLSQDQLKLKNIMWNIGLVYHSSPLSLFPLSGSIESDYYVNKAVLSELAEYASLIEEMLFHTNTGAQFSVRAQKNFNNFLKNASCENGQQLSKFYRDLGIRETQLIIRKEILRKSISKK